MNREQRRKNKKSKNEKGVSKKQQPTEEQIRDIPEKVALFEKIPNECNACTKPFNKENRMQVATWSVVVRNDINQVRLYCPDCWEKAKAVVQAYEKEKGYGGSEE
jgi:ribosomal protein L44E